MRRSIRSVSSRSPFSEIYPRRDHLLAGEGEELARELRRAQRRLPHHGQSSRAGEPSGTASPANSAAERIEVSRLLKS